MTLNKIVGSRLLQTLTTNLLEQYWRDISLAEICWQLIFCKFMRTHSYCQQKRFLSFCKIFDMGFDQSCTDTYIFIVLDGSIKRAASNQNWTHSAAAHPKMLTQSNNEAICTDWWKPSVWGERVRERVSLWVSRQAVLHGAGQGLTLQWHSFLWWSEGVRVLWLKVSRY